MEQKLFLRCDGCQFEIETARVSFAFKKLRIDSDLLNILSKIGLRGVSQVMRKDRITRNV